VVTRARHQARDLGQQLEGLGARVIYCPAIRITAPEDPAPFQAAVQQLATFDWLILTSANGVEALVEELNRQDKSTRMPTHLRVACVGPATADALKQHGIETAAVPGEFTSDHIADLVLESATRAPRVLLARAAGANAELPARLRAAGADVVDVQSYRSVPDLDNLAEVDAQLRRGAIDLVTFTSPSTAEHLLRGLSGALDRVTFAAIGPMTAQRLRELGLRAHIVAQDHTADGLVRAISDYYTSAEHERS
jgi:uroporphyrinogen III methyltransferase/synthase